MRTWPGALRERAAAAGCQAPDMFWRASEAALGAVYNGIGPEEWPPFLRELLSRNLNRLEPAALIHDFEYVFAKPDYIGFTAANWRLAINGIRLSTGWRGRAVALLLGVLCQVFGRRAFIGAHKIE
ncbi:MAG: hypothetical protein PHI35_03095 [Victivallaceae bacterium]|nr:hypothetical protein [Victivallaceae bacterium]